MAEPWSDGENEAIVRDYFVMLKNEQMGQAFNKAEHRRNLIMNIGRSNKSIEFKHMNISAVMEALGLPHIEGYTPLGNYQLALFEVVEAYLNERPDFHKLLIGEAGTLPEGTAESITGESIVFDTTPPERVSSDQDISEDIEPIVRRFEHPAERDARNRNLGKAGELLVYEHERLRLQTLGRKDLADSVRWVARDDGDGYGYDIRSFNGKGDEADRELWLEVKTTNGSATTPFYLTRNELQVSKQRPDIYRIVRIYDLRKQARAFCLAPPLERHVSLSPTIFRASF